MLHFLTQNDVTVIPRSKTPERIRENIEIFDFTLTGGEMDALAALDRKTAFVGNPNTTKLVEMSLSW